MDLRERENAVSAETHWYYRSKLIPVLRAWEAYAAEVEGPLIVVDFGAGSGFFGRSIAARYPDKVQRVLLVDIEYTDEELGTVAGGKVEKVRSLQPTQGAVFVMLMDVLEHLEDDHQVLRSVVEAVPDASCFFMTVPAFKSLWSRHDVVLGHYRRYRLKELCALTRSCGLQPTHSRYLFGGIFLPVYLIRRLRCHSDSEQSDLKPASRWMNCLLAWICGLEMRWARFNRWFGVTAMAVASKSDSYE